jgi:uncharacterized protein (DUF433 family)/DNA-binding transcriptional MerR regulator
MGSDIITCMSGLVLGDVSAAMSGCYDASRAAALSGVPKSTVYDWARKGVVVPSVSPVQEKLWSYADLMALRIVVWLRRPGKDDVRTGSPMSAVRRALEQLGEHGLDLWSEHADFSRGSPILVDQGGDIYLQLREGTFDLLGNRAFPQIDHFGLTGPFQAGGQHGPDLIRPRRHLRIVPDKVAGEPHVQGTRLTTRTLSALVDRGFDQAEVAEMYGVPRVVVSEAVDLEHDLRVA